MNKVYIAGAHSRGTTMGYYIKYLEPSTEIVAYVYDNDENNPEKINDVPVIKINSDTKLDVECPIYIAMRSVNHSHIINTLSMCGMKHIIPVDVKLDLDIRNKFLKKYYESVGKEYLKIDELDMGSHSGQSNSCKIYVAGSAFDKPLQDEYDISEYEKLIQVGTELTNKRLDTDCFDNIGANISGKNRQFCELTGLYWIWKNAKEDIVGLVHYRRHFTMLPGWLNRFENNSIDVILPTPLYVGPTLEVNYRKRHVESIIEYMYEYINSNRADEFTDVEHFFKHTSLYSPCNMFIMKKEILDELCTWLFPILFAVVEKCGELDDAYQNRYPGFLSERLITYYFEKNIDKYKVAYADKNFLS